MTNVVELMLAIKPGRLFFYHRDTNVIDHSPISAIEREHIDFSEDLSIDGDRNNIMLPTYEEIDHEGLMRFFVRECVFEKEQRKQLFYILRRHNYVDAFVEKLHEMDLYDEFVATCGDVYMRIFNEWAEDNNLTFKK